MNDLIDPKAKKLLLNKKENINYFIINIAGNNQNTISINNLLIRQLKSKYQATNSLRQDILINHLNNIKKVENKLDNIKSLKNNLDLTNKLLESLNNKKMIIIGISLVSIASIIQLSKLISKLSLGLKIKNVAINKLNKVGLGPINYSKIEGNYKWKGGRDQLFQLFMERVALSEGGYVNDPNDRGGATNKGITQRTYDAWNRSHNLPLKDVKFITRQEAYAIYKKNYFDNANIYEIATGKNGGTGDIELAFYVFDYGINAGVGSASKMLKKTGYNSQSFIQGVENRYEQIIQRDPSQTKFLEGWKNRVRNNINFTNQIINNNENVIKVNNTNISNRIINNNINTSKIVRNNEVKTLANKNEQKSITNSNKINNLNNISKQKSNNSITLNKQDNIINNKKSIILNSPIDNLGQEPKSNMDGI